MDMRDMRKRKRRTVMLPKSQTIFGPWGKPIEQTRTKLEVSMPTAIFFCPFCLHQGGIGKFQIRLKRGWSEKRFKCPDCGQVMQRKTLVQNLTIKEFAGWVYTSFPWKRISFQKFRKRLLAYGWAREFWAEYKRLKEEYPKDSYYDHLERQQADYQKEWEAEQQNGKE